MALTDAEKAQVRAHLGFSTIYIDTIAETRMNTLTTDELVIVRGYLANFATIDAKILALTTGSSVNVEQVDEVRFFGNPFAAADVVRRQGRMIVQQLSIMLGTTPLADYYGGGLGGSRLPALG